ncbi:MAG: hypothetical protein VX740_08365 [Pseudomonadota bacterium]|jgi:hypothetical protein|nr:hypothetical protein [Pseudomonadota bacterium]MED5423439.1 hypothetical protein [Pseudomonadota bacterium]MEE3322753.1 hypothetical protein [Pseudomonadota bacterium]
MDFIERLEQEEVDMLIKMPYRVGYWVSQSDTTGGDESEESELAALATIVRGYSEDFCKSEFVQRIMELTVENKGKWPEWQSNLNLVPNECRQLIAKLSDELPPREMDALRSNLYEIGLSVALAYREIDEDAFLTDVQKVWIMVRERIYAWREGRTPRSGAYLYNISGDEYLALRQLADVLSIPPTHMF